jgi:hypothetical protein
VRAGSSRHIVLPAKVGPVAEDELAVLRLIRNDATRPSLERAASINAPRHDPQLEHEAASAFHPCAVSTEFFFRWTWAST